jgi:hypothetical protein
LPDKRVREIPHEESDEHDEANSEEVFTGNHKLLSLKYLVAEKARIQSMGKSKSEENDYGEKRNNWVKENDEKGQ